VTRKQGHGRKNADSKMTTRCAVFRGFYTDTCRQLTRPTGRDTGQAMRKEEPGCGANAGADAGANAAVDGARDDEICVIDSAPRGG
jgi:hypothetical protein